MSTVAVKRSLTKTKAKNDENASTSYYRSNQKSSYRRCIARTAGCCFVRYEFPVPEATDKVKVSRSSLNYNS